MTEVQIIDDDAAVRQSIGMLLRSGGYASRGHASAIDFLRVADSLPPGCILTDLRMPGMDGIELIQHLKRRGVTHPVILMTGHGDIAEAMSAMKLGALDFLSKPFEAEELFRLVEKALEPVVRDSSDAAELKRSQSVFNGLSTRERAVLAGVVAGKTNKIMAHELELSPRTVEVYRASLMMKTGAASLLELVRMALAAGLDDAAQ